MEKQVNNKIYDTAPEAAEAALKSGEITVVAWGSENWKYLFDRADYIREFTDGTYYANHKENQRWCVKMLQRTKNKNWT